MSWAWWYIPAVLALRRWKQKDAEFEATLGYIRPCLEKTKTNKITLDVRLKK